MSVTVGHLRMSDVTLCSTCCGCSSHPRKSLRAHVPLHHPFSSSKEYIGCLDASIKDRMKQVGLMELLLASCSSNSAFICDMKCLFTSTAH